MKRIILPKKEPFKKKLMFDIPKTIQYSGENSSDLAKKMKKGEEIRWIEKIINIMDDK
jgi:hypothetical protein